MREPSIKGLPNLALLDIQEALLSVRSEWERLSDNFQLSEHLLSVQNLLDLCKAPISRERTVEAGNEDSREWFRSWKSADVRPCIQDLLRQPLRALQATNGNILANDGNKRSQNALQVANVPEIITEGTFLLVLSISHGLAQGTSW